MSHARVVKIGPRWFGLLGLAACVAAGCTRAPAKAASPPKLRADTAKMAAYLKERAASVDPARLVLLVNDRRAQALAAQIEAGPPPPARLKLRLAHATELLNAGLNEDSLRAIEAFKADARANPAAAAAVGASEPLLLEAMAFLRLAEEQNCHQSNTRDSCLLPIRGEGVHLKREGSTRAMKLLQGVLEKEPDNLTARWLLNIAAMTLGSYPAAVPRPYVIPESVFASEYPLPRFPNVAKESGLDVYGLSGGAILDDFDNDGDLDLMLSGMGFEEQVRLFRNDGRGRFEERTDQSGLLGEVGGLNMVHADFDNDGLVDILILRGGWMKSQGRFPMSLLRNNGDFTFGDVTEAAGLLPHLAPSQTATWLDYDGDGWLDLYVGNESAPPGSPPDEVHACELYHSNRDGTFTNVARESGVDIVTFAKAVTSGDYNNDGRPDIYVSSFAGKNRLLRNDGPPPGGGPGWRFTNVAAAAGVEEPFDSFGAFFFDYDNDGWQDLWVTGYSVTTARDQAADYLGLPTRVDRGRLYRNRGDSTFEDVTRPAGLYKVVPGMGLNFGDLDNDGFLDFYLGTGTPVLSTLLPNRMFRNDGGKRFQDVTTAGNFGHIQKGHAVCFGDVDADGDEDVVEKMGGAFGGDKAYTTLYANPGNANRWLGLQLEGVTANRSALGARIQVDVVGKGGSRSYHRTVTAGGTFGGSPLRQHIGLGDAERVTSVRITWPGTGRTQDMGALQMDRWHRIREGQ